MGTSIQTPVKNTIENNQQAIDDFLDVTDNEDYLELLRNMFDSYIMSERYCLTDLKEKSNSVYQFRQMEKLISKIEKL